MTPWLTKEYKITNKLINKTTFDQPLCHPGLSRILLLSKRFPIPKAFGRNDNHKTLLMNSLVISPIPPLEKGVKGDLNKSIFRARN
ncbi:MAG: hypothetical protein A2Y81_10085 [Nitrospirae bacterium RBG_13_43_8]|nr:MAG: hypothetical protein A2Y81_10085 [Nitrospirae bacterium RBG_13_43_8]